ncbi:putative protein kinase RLK-Pelle-LRR-III family [Helianthus annuus]|nr:putative protein kinase RLK-Pelle-LRR-III family [Helianthus annuus]
MSLVAVFLLSLFILPLQNECSADTQEVPDVPLNDVERKALLDFMKIRHSTGFTWNESEPACSWKGVYCFSNNNFTTVTHLQLPAKSFVGQIPPDTIGKLTSLRVLSLRYNGFYGELPSDFSNLVSLTRLSLHYNRFNGTIPSYFFNFTQLFRLSLNNNNFSGQLPHMNAKNLYIFDVSFNSLNSSIPRSLSNFNISAFSRNIFLCGPPTNTKCSPSYQSTDPGDEDKKENKTPIIVGISLGSSLVLLVLLCGVRKKIYQQPKQHLLRDERMEENKLVLFDNGVYSFDLEDLLKASAVFLGEGSVGKSYKQVIQDNTTVVVKRLKDVVVTENEFKRTMEGLGSIKNKNIFVPLIGYYYSRDERLVIYDYIPARSLSALLHGGIGSQRTQLDWDHRMRIVLSVAKGLKNLHMATKVVHGNIKSSNILIQHETNNDACLSDYGLNTLFGESIFDNHHVTGYWAPEIPKSQKVTFESDVYSFGVLLVELLTGKNPKQASLRKERVHFSKLVESVVCEESKVEMFDVELRMSYNIEEMMQLLHIAKQCLLIVPDQRPTMQDVLSKVEDMGFRHTPNDHSKEYDYTPSTETHDTPSTITP